ncbi:iron-hydroxamate ABC transporter substrate-binding protein [Listeria fleischmannii]|uniref:iron-hydroxamate ABC transporter substrate-binding protein n=1 Tax=Listeria fleischmannii TaxID=1069827 RepID=UPI001627782F|nr:iron-hydroxamate ABC transporter substrate-binding protein [Listeria fleischmannii]MBC1418672.1 iron-hydroxamate ABC transporter substrate-binding protein [Listeria fleischmannii]
MKKIVVGIFVILTLALAACGTSDSDKANSKSEESKTITYQSENGAIEVPKNPKRVVVLTGYAGDLIQLGVPIVGADSYSMDNPNFKEGLKDAKLISEENVEDIIALKPDLIIGASTSKNQDKLKKIAPLVTFTYGKNDYLQQHIEIGKTVNKEKEATDWANDFEKRAEEAGKEIKDKIGADTTISVAENFDKQLYVFGDNWGRGTEILYQAMGLKMPQTVKDAALKAGYYAVSPEELGKYTGDYMVLSKTKGQDASFMDTATYKEIPAVKNNRVLQVKANEFYFNDALTLEFQLQTFKNYFLGK